MLKEIKKIEENFLRQMQGAGNADDLERIRIAYLGRKGSIADIFKQLKLLDPASKKEAGKEANALRARIEHELNKKLVQFGALDAKAKDKSAREFFDVSFPAKKMASGSQHPLSIVQSEATDIFFSMGFSVVEGPEIETEHNNFDALNIPKDHPARDMWDTFWIKTNYKEKLLLRTHTSPVQIRHMETRNPPLRIIAPGRCFRYEATDARHEIQFYQLEGLMVGKDVSLANLKAVIERFLRGFFGKNVDVRFLPSYFPFVEPGVEVEASCFLCSKKRQAHCPVCGGAGWFEIMGAGMVHRAVFENVGVNPSQWRGFAFGVGLDRLAMLKYKIHDIRLLYGSDLRFLRQFK